MKTYQPLSRFVLRTPTLPFDVLAGWQGDRETLRALVENPAIREALYVASPELEGQIAAWIAEPETQAGVGVERALVRYISRMASRSTPFGLFASVAVGKVGDKTDLAVAPRTEAERHTRLDNDFLFQLCTDVGRAADARESLRYRPNTSLYTAAGRMRYAEARLHGPVRAYHLVAVDPSPYLDMLLERAAHGATRDELCEVLCTDPEITHDEAAGFVDEVIASQLLVAELAPAVTGREPTEHIIDTLAAQRLEPYAAPLREASARIAVIDASKPGVPSDAYRAIEKLLGASLPTRVEPSRLFQVDLFKPSQAQIGEAVLADFRKAAELLRSITPGGGDPAWQRFRDKFSNRYETREVPLLEVLDEEVGIGFGDDNHAGNSPLLAELAFPGRFEPRRVSMGGRELHLMKLLAQAMRDGAHEISLTDADIDQIKFDKPANLANTVTCSGVLVGESPEAVAEGRYQIRVSFVGTGANILGRFCHGSEELAALTAEALRAEEAHHPNAVFAEIVHLPEGRLGNILLRPVLREYEIPYLGTSGAPDDKQITVSDLLVTVINGRVVLKSKRLGCEVIPRMTTAHNYGARSLAVYRFLCSHANQHVNSAYWSWGAVNDFPFLPRVRYGKIVLERARWIVSAKDLEPIEAAFAGSNAAKTPEQIRAIRKKVVAAMQDLRARLRLPRWVVLGDGDNELPIDFENELVLDSAAHLLKGRNGAQLYELFPAPGQMCARGPEGTFAHELILLLAREAPQLARGSSARIVTTPPAEPARRFLPGDSWLYVKLYTGTATADTLLREYIAPVVENAIQRGLASSWFFIRYGDPDWHVRLRFRGDPAKLYGELLPQIHEALAPAATRGLMWRLVVDTYEREVERYGGAAGIEIAEELFRADSDAVLAIVSSCEGDAGADAAWRLALYGIDRLMEDLGMAVEEKLAAMTRARDVFGAEVGMNTSFQKQLGDKFRKHAKELAALLATGPEATDHPFAPALAAFAKRSATIRPLGAQLAALAATNRLTLAPTDLVQSYIHMHVNRMIRTSARLHELVLYDLLRRHYDGVIARNRHKREKLAHAG